MTYATKVRITKYTLPVIVVLVFGVMGYSPTRNLFAQSSSVAIGISMASDHNTYTIGQDVALTLSNASKQNVYVVNRCPSEPLMVYRQVGTTWVNIVATTNASKCIGEPHDYKIAANTSLKINYNYWPNLFDTAGTYRIIAPIESFDVGPSVTFTVQK